MLPRSHYPHPFHADDFYYIPKSWLRTVTQTSELDVGEALLFMLYDGLSDGAERQLGDGCVELDEKLVGLTAAKRPNTDRNFWGNPDTGRGLPPLCSLSTYTTCIKLLVGDDNQPFKKYEKREHPSLPLEEKRESREVAKERKEYKESQEGLEYELREWPPRLDDLIYVPRGYLLNRWPVWLGRNSFGARAARLAICALMSQSAGMFDRAAWTLNDIVKVARQLLPGLIGDMEANGPLAHKDFVRNDIERGLRQLEALDAVRKNGKLYQLKLTSFSKPPHCIAIERILPKSNLFAGQLHLRLIATRLVNECYLSLTQLDDFVKGLENRRKNDQWFIFPYDFHELANFISRGQPAAYAGPVLSIRKTINEFVDSKTKAGRRIPSELFTLRLAPDARAKSATSGQMILLSAPQPRPPQTIHLQLELISRDGSTPEQALTLAKQYWLVVEQFQKVKLKGHAPTNNAARLKPRVKQTRRYHLHLHSLSLAQLLPQEVVFNAPLTLDANPLNPALNFSLPFRLTLIHQSPEMGNSRQSSSSTEAATHPKIDLEGRILAYYPLTHRRG